MRARVLIAALASVFAVVVGGTGRNVAAHPLGNFSISQYSAIRIAPKEITVRYVLDLAEIPTFQEIQEANIIPEAADAAVEKYVATKTGALRDALWLEVNGRRLALQPESYEIIFPPGAGGLPTMKIGVLFKAEMPADSSTTHYLLNYRDGNFSGRAGWKEIIAVADSGASILDSSVPGTDRSAQLSNYPTDLLDSPPQRLEARVTFAPGSGSQVNPNVENAGVRFDQTGSSERVVAFKKTAVIDNDSTTEKKSGDSDSSLPRESRPPHNSSSHRANLSPAPESIEIRANTQPTPRDSFTELIASAELGWSIILIALAVAVALGAFHALEPGHGKTLVAAYLVGSRGTMKHALLLGLIVTVAHTAGVYLLGGITLYASQHIVPEQLYPWLGVTSGLMITILGMVLVIRRWRGTHAGHSHPGHTHGQYPHHAHEAHDGHHHVYGNHGHHHGTASLRELLTLGISGGVIPCPAALVVLLSAVSMNRTGFGLLLIIAFSAGLAAVLIAIGVAMVYARRFMSGFQGEGKWVTHWLPLASSTFIVAIGIGLTWQSWSAVGIILLAGA